MEVVAMNADRNRRSSIAEIDYSRETLFGPIPMQATCRVRLATVEQGRVQHRKPTEGQRDGTVIAIDEIQPAGHRQRRSLFKLSFKKSIFSTKVLFL